MQWSKLKTRLKAFIAPELSDRIDFHFARYRHAHDQVGRIWFTVDKVEVSECSELKWLKNWRETKTAEDHFVMLPRAISEDEDVFTEHEGKSFLTAFLDMPIADALRSKNHLIHAFAIIDRRLGKRSFEKIHLAENEHPLVQAFYKLRLNAFGLNTVLKN